MLLSLRSWTDGSVTVDIALVAYSPVSRGWLTGEIRKPEDIPETDPRRYLARFQAGAVEQNFKLVEAVEKIAERKGATVAQVAIAWVRRQGAIPIPGSRKVERVVENCRDVDLDASDLAEIQKLLESLPISGGRYPPSVRGPAEPVERVAYGLHIQSRQFSLVFLQEDHCLRVRCTEGWLGQEPFQMFSSRL